MVIIHMFMILQFYTKDNNRQHGRAELRVFLILTIGVRLWLQDYCLWHVHSCLICVITYNIEHYTCFIPLSDNLIQMTWIETNLKIYYNCYVLIQIIQFSFTIYILYACFSYITFWALLEYMHFYVLYI